MPKEQWKQCNYCRIITDVDEKDCPGRGLKDNPRHKLQVVELEDKEVKKLYKKGEVWTKCPIYWERRLAQ